MGLVFVQVGRQGIFIVIVDNKRAYLSKSLAAEVQHTTVVVKISTATIFNTVVRPERYI